MKTDQSLAGQSVTGQSVTGERRTGLRDDAQGYGWVSIALHWLVALTVPGLFALGLWMTGLGYYDEWYRRAPELHKGVGVMLFLAMLLRVSWRMFNPRPDEEPTVSSLQRRIARLVHQLLYLLLFFVMISGYLISTADGRPIEVFGLFSVPATLSGLPGQEDLAGRIHWYLALALSGLVLLHALAALKHHLVDHDLTLKKMLGCRCSR